MGESGHDNIYQMPAAEIVGVLQEVLSDSDAESMLGMDEDEAIGYLFTVLPEHGIEDPESFLREKGILE